MEELNKHNIEGYIVGGFVRDYLLNKTINDDIDLVINANIKDLIKLNYDIKVINASIYVFKINLSNKLYDLVVFREDIYNNKKTPKCNRVYSITEDVKRRDFTINSIYMNYLGEIIDPLNGVEDLKNNLLKPVKEPNQLINEDPTRALRAIRFSTKYELKIDTHLHEKINSDLDFSLVSKTRLVKELISLYELKSIYKLYKYNYSYNDINEFFNSKEEIIKDKYSFILYLSLNDDNIINLLSFKDKSHILNLREIYKAVGNLDLDILTLFTLGINKCLTLNNINIINGYEDKSKDILNRYNNLPIKQSCDLKFKGVNVQSIFKEQDTNKILDIMDEVKINILYEELNNDFKSIHDYIKTKYYNNNS